MTRLAISVIVIIGLHLFVSQAIESFGNIHVLFFIVLKLFGKLIECLDDILLASSFRDPKNLVVACFRVQKIVMFLRKMGQLVLC